MADFSLGGVSKDFDSKRSREVLINLVAEGSKDGNYRSVRRTEGLTHYVDLPSGAPRSNTLVNGDYLYVIAGTQLYRVKSDLTVEDLGFIGGSGRGSLEQNSAPGGNQICALNGDGDGYIYTVGGALQQITDVDFFPTTSVTVLNERFWFSRDGTNEFFGSEVSNGLSYNPLTFGTAEESPDNVVQVIAKKSSLWVIGEETGQYYQTFDDIVFPLRAVKGTSKERGIGAHDSLAEVSDNFVFLADDGTVMMVRGTEMARISTLDLELKIKGNGTLTSPGFTNPSSAIGYFIDGPVHKTYVLTFPDDNYTWCFDLETGFPHERASEGKNTYRVGSSDIFDSQLIGGDLFEGKLWILDPNAKTEGDEIQRTVIRSPSVSHEKNITIPLIEVDMEVGQEYDPNFTPMLMVRYSKNGGYTWINKEPITLGNQGFYETRVPLRRFGRLVRNKDFILELSTTDPVRIQYYGAKWYPEASI